MRNQKREAVRPLWRQHLRRPFPPGMRGEEMSGVDMVMVDADIAGCVVTWLDSSSDLDAWRVGVLRECLAGLARALPALGDPQEVKYFSALGDLAAAVLREQSSSG